MAALELLSSLLFTDANLVSYYKGEDVTDSKGSNTLTNNGSVPFNAAKFNNGFDLGASNGTKYLSRLDNLGINGNGDLSVLFWIKLQTAISASSYELFVHASTGGADRYLEPRYNYNAGTPQISVDVSGTTFTYTITLSTSVYQMIAITRNVSGNSCRLYVDGTDVAGGTIGSSTGSANYYYIGANSAGSFPNSAIYDDMAIFNRVLTPTEISNHFSGLDPLSSGRGFFMAA